MTHDEARSLLIEQGAKLLAAQYKVWEGRREIDDALAPLLAPEEDGIFAEFTVDEQEECFLESCCLADISWQHPCTTPQHNVFKRRRHRELEARINQQRENASMN